MKPKSWLVGLFALAASLHSEACGPFFQVMITTCGRECLLFSPDRNPFQDELFAIFKKSWSSSTSQSELAATPTDTRQLSLASSTPAQRVTLQHALLAPSGAESYRRSQGLPEAVRLYAAGAVAFRLSRQPLLRQPVPGALLPEGHRAVAIQYFNRVAALPSAEAGPRRLWALYSLGRAWSDTGGAGALKQAEESFQRVVREAPKGTQDPLQLRIAAMGALGGLAYEQGHLGTATRWYLQQAQQPAGPVDVESLAMVAEKALAGGNSQREVALLVKRLQNAQLQHVIAAYTVATYPGFEREWHNRHSVLLAALRQLPKENLQEADRFGLVAFQLKDYKLAKQLLESPKTSAGHWVAAKLALYDGNSDLAAQHYAAAAKGFPPGDPSLLGPAGDNEYFRAEWSVLKLVRGDYVEALVQLDRLTPPRATVDSFETALKENDYRRNPPQDAEDYYRREWPSYYEEPEYFRKDVAWVAERVLTTDELAHYVDTHPKASWLVRSILSRRLVREDRLGDAIRHAYTKADADRIRRFRSARAKAMDKSLSLDARVRAVLLAAYIEIKEGMELRGTELYPDYAAYLGDYSLDELKPSDLAQPDERARVAASRAKPEQRFHYRKIAAQRLYAFSRTLPTRSEELTVLLCEADKISLEEPYDAQHPSATFYREYQKRGRYFPEDRRFGTVCPKLHGVAISYAPQK